MEWIGGILLGAIAGYLLEFTRPWVKSYLDKGSSTLRERRIARLTHYYTNIKNYKENPPNLNLFVFREISVILFFLIFEVSTFGLVLLRYFEGINNPIVGIMDSFAIGIASFYPATKAWILAGDISNIIKFSQFQGTTLSKLRKLGYSVEDARELIGQKD